MTFRRSFLGVGRHSQERYMRPEGGPVNFEQLQSNQADFLGMVASYFEKDFSKLKLDKDQKAIIGTTLVTLFVGGVVPALSGGIDFDSGDNHPPRAQKAGHVYSRASLSEPDSTLLDASDVVTRLYEKGFDPKIPDSLQEEIDFVAELKGIKTPVEGGISGIMTLYKDQPGNQSKSTFENLLEDWRAANHFYLDSEAGDGTYLHVGFESDDKGNREMVVNRGFTEKEVNKHTTLLDFARNLRNSIQDEQWVVEPIAPSSDGLETPMFVPTQTEVPIPEAPIVPDSVKEQFCGEFAELCADRNVYGYDLNGDKLMFAEDKNTKEAYGFMFINNKWIQIYGGYDEVSGLVVWGAATSDVTPIAPGVGVTSSVGILTYNVKDGVENGNIVLNYTPPYWSENYGDGNQRLLYRIPKDSPVWGATTNLVPVSYEYVQQGSTRVIDNNGSGEVVQIFEGGKWVDLRLPDTIWGKKPEGASIVLENGVPTLRMELNNFQTEDGDSFADIAEYDRESEEWKVKPFSITRSGEILENELYSLNYGFKKYSYEEQKINFLYSRAAILGVRTIDSDLSGLKLEFLILYDKNVLLVSPSEISFSVQEDADPYYDDSSSLNENLSVSLAMEIVRRVGEYEKRIRPWLGFLVLQPSANQESCNSQLELLPVQKFKNWCEAELIKGKLGKRPNKDNIEWIFRNTTTNKVSSDNVGLDNLSSLWGSAGKIDPIDGAYFFLPFFEN